MQRRTALNAIAMGLATLVAGLCAPAFARCEDVTPGQRPQNTPHDFVGQTLDEITERGFITFALYEDYPPYSFGTADAPKGIDVEIGRLIAKELGVEPQFRFGQAGENLQTDLMTYVWRGSVVGDPVANVMLRVPYDSAFACRVDQVVFTGQYATEEIAIAYSRAAYPDVVISDADRHEGGPVPAFFRFDSVAVENDSISDFYLTSFPGGGIGPNIHRYHNMTDAMAALKSGEVMAAMGPRAEMQYAADESVAVHKPPMPGFALSKWTVGVAVHTSHRDLAYAIDDAIAAALADGRIAAIHAQYGVSFTPPER